MPDRHALFERFLDLLQNNPLPPDFLEAEPVVESRFDPYQMVAEWIALRQEVKQQGKLLQASQNTLQQALEGVQAEKAQLQQRLEESQKQSQVQGEREQKALWLDVLEVVDALDQALDNWQERIDSLARSPQTSEDVPIATGASLPPWKRWVRDILQLEPTPTNPSPPTTDLREMLVSDQQGVALIRRSLLDILRQRQIFPLNAQGQPFDPQRMYAIGRQESDLFPESIVIQEVVRGYLWRDQVLREARVIVSAGGSKLTVED